MNQLLYTISNLVYKVNHPFSTPDYSNNKLIRVISAEILFHTSLYNFSNKIRWPLFPKVFFAPIWSVQAESGLCEQFGLGVL
jgi:hypothetical protein